MLKSLNKYLLLWGVPGLLAIAFLDSAGVPMMGGPDAVVLLLAWQRPMQVLIIVLAAAVGSTLGSLLLYRVGRAGGEMALGRFSPEKRAWVKERLDRNAFYALLVAVIVPPPFPMKLFILAAGTFHVRASRLMSGVLAGRLLRYGLLAYLGARFGDHAADALKQHYTTISLLLIAIVMLVIVLRRFRGFGKDVSGKNSKGVA